MSEIEITLPTVQYGNIKITATPEEWGLDTIADAPDVGVWAATYLNLFQQGFKHGATLDVDAHLSAPVSAPEGAVGAQAREWLDKGLGGVTEVPAGDIVAHEDSTEEVSDDGQNDAPWNSEVASKPKPWETGEQAPAAPAVKLDSSW